VVLPAVGTSILEQDEPEDKDVLLVFLTAEVWLSEWSALSLERLGANGVAEV
jgi:hypothetical protein